jgi:hypothetical protein
MTSLVIEHDQVLLHLLLVLAVDLSLGHALAEIRAGINN